MRFMVIVKANPETEAGVMARWVAGWYSSARPPPDQPSRSEFPWRATRRFITCCPRKHLTAKQIQDHQQRNGSHRAECHQNGMERKHAHSSKHLIHFQLRPQRNKQIHVPIPFQPTQAFQHSPTMPKFGL